MDYLAIRDSECKNVYYFKTKGEKGRILSKFPNASNRVFLEDEKDLAIRWAGVDRIATEEENLWAITKQPKIAEKKEEIKNVVEDNTTSITKNVETTNINKKDNEENTNIIEKKSDDNSMLMFLEKMTKIDKQDNDNEVKKDVVNKTNEENKCQEENTIKHIMSDFEKIVEIYKKNGIKLLEVTINNGNRYCLLTDDLYYISNFGTLPIDVPFASLNEKDLKELVFSIIDDKKANGEKNISFNTLLSLDMFEKINKTKYLAFGDLVYASDLNFVQQNRVNKDIINYSLEDDIEKKHITFNTSSILSIKPCDVNSFNYIVREKEFSTYIKKALKQLEKQKLKEKELEKVSDN